MYEPGLKGNQAMYPILDFFFLVFHSLLVGFNLTGWIWKKTRRLHLCTISATLISWFGLGIFYGWGYCPSTDWHWQVKRELGETDLPASYIKYYADKLTGSSWDPLIIDSVTLVCCLMAFTLSVWVNSKRWKQA